MRRFPAGGSRTAANCGKGISAGREQRKAERLKRIVADLPRLKFDIKGETKFTPDSPEQLAALRIAAQRHGWMLTSMEGSDVVNVVCVVKAKAYDERQRMTACKEAIPRLEFIGSTAHYKHNADADVVLGLELLCKSHGWTIQHKGMVAEITRPARKAA